MEEAIRLSLKALRSGGTLLYPTDTVWGIGCDATSEKAVEKVYRIKQRTESKSLIVLLDDPRKISRYVSSVPGIAWDLLDRIDTPLTIIYPGARGLAGNVVAADGSVAIRIVNHEFCHILIASFGKPIVSTSANISGDPPPLTYRHIAPEIIQGVDYAVPESLGPLQEVKPSRIIKLTPEGEFQIIRP
jgi:L-threonylcarbamoyladenylate synthase